MKKILVYSDPDQDQWVVNLSRPRWRFFGSSKYTQLLEVLNHFQQEPPIYYRITYLRKYFLGYAYQNEVIDCQQISYDLFKKLASNIW